MWEELEEAAARLEAEGAALAAEHAADLTDFYRRLGPEFNDFKFKPTYNPYTEPSMEFHCFHPGLKKWVEVGNSGVFRPEMLRPMGFDEDVSRWDVMQVTEMKLSIQNMDLHFTEYAHLPLAQHR